MAHCARCNRKFEATRRGVLYCSPACKTTAHRYGLDVAEVVRTHIKPGTTLGGDTDLQARLRELISAYPAAMRLFGEPMLRAALDDAKWIPAGGCRWCLARMHAVMSDRPKPRLSRAGRTLLGEPCDTCANRDTETGRSAAATETGSGAGSRSVSHSTAAAPRPPKMRHLSREQREEHAHDRCVLCAQRPLAMLTAGGDLQSHPPWFSSIDDYRRWIAEGRPKRWASR
jgi:hypothetical protein